MTTHLTVNCELILGKSDFPSLSHQTAAHVHFYTVSTNTFSYPSALWITEHRIFFTADDVVRILVHIEPKLPPRRSLFALLPRARLSLIGSAVDSLTQRSHIASFKSAPQCIHLFVPTVVASPLIFSYRSIMNGYIRDHRRFLSETFSALSTNCT